MKSTHRQKTHGEANTNRHRNTSSRRIVCHSSSSTCFTALASGHNYPCHHQQSGHAPCIRCTSSSRPTSANRPRILWSLLSVAVRLPRQSVVQPLRYQSCWPEFRGWGRSRDKGRFEHYALKGRFCPMRLVREITVATLRKDFRAMNFYLSNYLSSSVVDLNTSW